MATTTRTTPKQERVVDAVVRNGRRRKPLPSKEVLAEAGYSEALQNQPSRVLNAPGVKARVEALGLTESLVVEALVSDIKGKKKKRYNELSLASDILGLKSKQNDGGGNNTTNILNIISLDGRGARIARRIAIRYGGVNKESGGLPDSNQS